MKFVIAMDSFKGSMTSLQAGAAVKRAAVRVFPGAEVVVLPFADGGEGTAESLTTGLGGRFEAVRVTGPLGEPVEARYGIAGRTAVIEMAEAAGLPLVPPDKRNPLETTTYGVGELIGDALDKGCRDFVLGLGGSATNDGGIGMLEALGFDFLDSEGRPVPRGGKGLEHLASIRTDGARPELSECTFRAACDVDSPLTGPFGASAVFGPQKGADPEMVERLDRGLANYAEIAEQLPQRKTGAPKSSGGSSSVSAGAASPGGPASDDPGVTGSAGSDSRKLSDAPGAADRPVPALSDTPGAGAAGGMGFAVIAFLHGELLPGTDLVIRVTGLEREIEDADLVVTGEGRIDAQTGMGKGPVRIARLAKKYGKTVLAFGGSIADDAGVCNENGIDAFFPILRSVVTLEEALDPKRAAENLERAAEQVFRLIRAHILRP
ncbi:MAG: glycerate kinase [Anaerovoracaceae bacterium]|jgi:glycerate kinase